MNFGPCRFIDGTQISSTPERFIAAGVILLAVLTIALFLFLAMPIRRLLGQKGLTMMMKLTGLILTAIAAQIILTGVRDFLQLGNV